VIALVDYGAGNLTSVRKALSALGATFMTPGAAAELEDATAVIVPGVGHFAATSALDEEWRQAIGGAARAGIPLFGICVGMQWLFEGSDEAPDVRGLAAVAGRCRRLPPSVKVPHVGWNAIEPVRPSVLLDGIPDGTQVYFTHSYAAPVTADAVAVAVHGWSFAAAVERGNVFGVQFHPEKSGPAGIRVLRNFLAAVRSARCSRSA
jgi:glutamine amidotransferase